MRRERSAPAAVRHPGADGAFLNNARDICLTLVALVLFLLGVECALRFAGVNYDASLYRLDRDLGYELRPGAAGWSVKERPIYERVSSQGLRDREHSLTRPPHVIRIAVVGDSFAEAKQVQAEDAYWAVMERELNRLLKDSGERIEVINFGVAGYGLSQEYLVIRDRIWRYDPQIVVLTGTLHSLILNTRRSFGMVRAGEGPVPFFVRSAHGLTLDPQSAAERQAFVPQGRLDEMISDVTNSSRIVALLNAARRTIAEDIAAYRHGRGVGAAAAAEDPDKQTPAQQMAAFAANYENKVLRGPVDAQLADAWQISEQLIRLSQAESARHHAEFWFFLFDMAPQIDPDPQRREFVAQALGLHDLFLADRRLADFAARAGIRHDMLAPSMLAASRAQGTLLHGFVNRPRNSGHWNENGHRVVGDLMALRLFHCSDVIRAERRLPPGLEAGDCGDGDLH